MTRRETILAPAGPALLLSLLATPTVAQDRLPTGRESLQRRISNAIDSGVEFLLDGQLIDGSWEFQRSGYPAGMTALAVYTLLKSGVPTEHRAVRQGLEFLRTHPPSKTYSAACLLMALEATKDPAHLPWMRKVLVDLIDWQLKENGIWWYSGENRTEVAPPDRAPPRDREPRGGARGPKRTPGDLSNTQYAALGLRAAHLAGIRIPSTVLRRLSKGTIAYQETIRKAAGRGPTTGAHARPSAAGFRYRLKRDPTGSMTSAGIAIQAICEQILGSKASGSERSAMRAARLAGLSWMIDNFSVRTNPGMGNWLYYYLYGLERVGSLLEIERLGEHEWYWEGAQFLVARQHSSGAWSPRRNAEAGRSECDTCFALLFLERATSTTTGASTRAPQKVYCSSASNRMVVLHGAGDSPLSLWISMSRADGKRGDAHQHYDLAFVHYQARGACASEWTSIRKVLVAAPTNRATVGRGAIQHSFERCGRYFIRARVGLRPAARAAAGTAPCVETTHPIEVAIDYLEDPERIAYGSDARRNLFKTAGPSVATSSGDRAEALIDDDPTTFWQCDRDDRAPEITIELGRKVSAKAILFTHAFNRGRDCGREGRPAQVRVFVNGDSRPIVQAIDPDPRTKTVLRLRHSRSIRRLCIQIDRGDGTKSHSGSTGFAEIELQR